VTGSVIIKYLFAGIILLISINDMYKGILLVFSNQNPKLFVAKIGFWVLRFLPGTEREGKIQHALRVYTKRKRVYGAFAIVGSAWFILVAYLMIRNA